MKMNTFFVKDKTDVTSDNWRFIEDKVSHLIIQFLSDNSAASFNSGLYRVHSSQQSQVLNKIFQSTFSYLGDTFVCFASNWRGDVFAIDFYKEKKNLPSILMFDGESGTALEIPATFHEFHESTLYENREVFFDTELYSEWLGVGRKPAIDECAGLKVPAFLGGMPSTDNIELIDLEVFWAITSQLIETSKRLPDGTPIDNFNV